MFILVPCWKILISPRRNIRPPQAYAKHQADRLEAALEAAAVDKAAALEAAATAAAADKAAALEAVATLQAQAGALEADKDFRDRQRRRKCRRNLAPPDLSFVFESFFFFFWWKHISMFLNFLANYGHVALV